MDSDSSEDFFLGSKKVEVTTSARRKGKGTGTKGKPRPSSKTNASSKKRRVIRTTTSDVGAKRPKYTAGDDSDDVFTPDEKSPVEVARNGDATQASAASADGVRRSVPITELLTSPESVLLSHFTPKHIVDMFRSGGWSDLLSSKEKRQLAKFLPEGEHTKASASYFVKKSPLFEKSVVRYLRYLKEGAYHEDEGRSLLLAKCRKDLERQGWERSVVRKVMSEECDIDRYLSSLKKTMTPGVSSSSKSLAEQAAEAAHARKPLVRLKIPEPPKLNINPPISSKQPPLVGVSPSVQSTQEVLESSVLATPKIRLKMPSCAVESTFSSAEASAHVVAPAQPLLGVKVDSTHPTSPPTSAVGSTPISVQPKLKLKIRLSGGDASSTSSWDPNSRVALSETSASHPDLLIARSNPLPPYQTSPTTSNSSRKA